MSFITEVMESQVAFSCVTFQTYTLHWWTCSHSLSVWNSSLIFLDFHDLDIHGQDCVKAIMEDTFCLSYLLFPHDYAEFMHIWGNVTAVALFSCCISTDGM